MADDAKQNIKQKPKRKPKKLPPPREQRSRSCSSLCKRTREQPEQQPELDLELDHTKSKDQINEEDEKMAELMSSFKLRSPKLMLPSANTNTTTPVIIQGDAPVQENLGCGGENDSHLSTPTTPTRPTSDLEYSPTKKIDISTSSLNTSPVSLLTVGRHGYKRLHQRNHGLLPGNASRINNGTK